MITTLVLDNVKRLLLVNVAVVCKLVLINCVIRNYNY